jgi:hypothetical protein
MLIEPTPEADRADLAKGNEPGTKLLLNLKVFAGRMGYGIGRGAASPLRRRARRFFPILASISSAWRLAVSASA